MDKTIQDFIECKRLAVIGASRTGDKFGNMAFKELQERDYQVFIVHPEADEIDG
jgi:predicted CoA-binding protein